MKNKQCMDHLNGLLKWEKKKKQKKKKNIQRMHLKEDQENGVANCYATKSNKQYMNTANEITKQYASKINEILKCEKYDITYTYEGEKNGTDQDENENYYYEHQGNQFHSTYKRENIANDIEFTQKNSLEICFSLCKIKGHTIRECHAGMFNEVVFETYNNLGELVYAEHTVIDAFIKEKEQAEKLNFVKTETDNSHKETQGDGAQEEYSFNHCIHNNLYTPYVYDKHHDSIQNPSTKYNIDANFSNYRTLPQKKNDEQSSLVQHVKGLNTHYNSPFINNENERNEQRDSNKRHNFLSNIKRESQKTNTNAYTLKDPFENTKNYRQVNDETKKNASYNSNYGNQRKYNSSYVTNYEYLENTAFSEQPSIITHYKINEFNETIKGAYIFRTNEFSTEDKKLIDTTIACNIKNLKNGTYIITFNIRKSGSYYLSIFVNKHLAANCPYLIYVKPSIAHPSNCIIYKTLHNKIITPKNVIKKNRQKKQQQKGKTERKMVEASYLQNIMAPLNMSDQFIKKKNRSLQRKKLSSYLKNSYSTGNKYEAQTKEERQNFQEEGNTDKRESFIGFKWERKNTLSGTDDETFIKTHSETDEEREMLEEATDTNESSDTEKEEGETNNEKEVYEWALEQRRNESSPPKSFLKCYTDDGDDDDEEIKTFSNFFIESYDAYNNKITDGKDQYEIKSLGSVKIVEINNFNNGTYEVIYRYLKDENTYREIQITLNGFHVKGSPFLIILKNDKNKTFLKTLKNILPISNVDDFNPEQKLLHIMQSYKYVKERNLSEARDNKTLFISLHPYYTKKELISILKKIDKNIITLMSLPMKEQLFHYMKHLQGDKKIAELKKTLFKELLVANCKMLSCASSLNQHFQTNKKELAHSREIGENTLEEINRMYTALKNKTIRTLPFTFEMKDMDLYEKQLKLKKQELITKQNQLVQKYEELKNKELQFCIDRKNITEKLRDKYELHQDLYEASRDALLQKTNSLKHTIVTNIKKQSQT